MSATCGESRSVVREPVGDSEFADLAPSFDGTGVE